MEVATKHLSKPTAIFMSSALQLRSNFKVGFAVKHRLLTLPLLASLIVACSDSDTLELAPKLANPDLVYSYPTDGQRNVSPATDVVLRFSEPVDSDSLQRSARLRSEVGDVDYVITSIDDGYS